MIIPVAPSVAADAKSAGFLTDDPGRHVTREKIRRMHGNRVSEDTRSRWTMEQNLITSLISATSRLLYAIDCTVADNRTTEKTNKKREQRSK